MFTQEDGRDKLERLKNYFSGKQEASYRSIGWLITDNEQCRGSGRSYLLAVLYIEEAINNPGKVVHLIDHNIFNGNAYSLIPIRELKNTIRTLCENYSLPIIVWVKDNWIRFSPQENRRILPDRRKS